MIELRFSLPPAGLRRNAPTNRFTANKLKDEYAQLMGISMSHQPNVHIYRHWARRLPIKYDLHAEIVWRQVGKGDVDNCIPKATLDNLGCAPVTKAGEKRFYIGIYESDAQIKKICVERERVARKVDECVIIRLLVLDTITG